MKIEKEIQERSGGQCELCGASDELKIYQVPPTKEGVDSSAMICSTCLEQIEDPEKIDINHWRCINDSMWSPVPAVQVLSYRMLKQLNSEDWARDLLDMLYLDEETTEWATALEPDENAIVHLDSNGVKIRSWRYGCPYQRSSCQRNKYDCQTWRCCQKNFFGC